MSTEQLLEERGYRYGNFEDNAKLTQALFQTLMQTYYTTHQNNTVPLPPTIVEALHMISGKLSRAMCGDPLYEDNWKDIAGYSQLVVDHLSTLTKG